MTKAQSYSNHAKLDRKWHGVLFFFWLFFAVLMYRGLFAYLLPVLREMPLTAWSVALTVFLFLRPIAVFILLLTVRGYALVLQDRLIRLEETVRHQQIIGDKPDPALSLNQLIALRFASDEELPELASQALSENLNSKQIKAAIKNRKADHLRV